MTALIVDDEPDICHLVSSMLKNEGLQCVTIGSFTEGLDCIRDSSFDIAFLDLNLQDGSGYDLIGPLKEKNPNSKLCVISAHDNDQERQKALNLGADLFISKPFTRKDILNTIDG